MPSTPAIILFLPLIAAAVILVASKGFKLSATICALLSTGSVVITLCLSLFLIVNTKSGAADEVVTLFTWADFGSLQLEINAMLDRLSRGMLFVVTFIGTLVHVFSLGYMKDDEGKARYFAGLSLFMFSMTGIVLADNFAMMFIFWELVGVSSYLLIGHWYTKSSAAEAAKKAFLTNRIGDFGFMIGILILFGATGAITFAGVEQGIAGDALTGGLLTAATLCIFCGAVGKSAQFPLHVWLPDAMEGPTPVSALIHAATMVAAGVYMLVRVIFLVEADATAATVISWIGGITALLAALMATQQDDIKRILAYSTLSQLGYMVMAVGLAAGQAAMFHLFTHAFFKALLFLGSGAIIFACHHDQDIWKMGGLKDKMKGTFRMFAVGTAALIAVPLTSGFFSKELILEAAHHESSLLFVIASGVALLTAFYMTRLFVVVFFGKPRTDHANHATEVPTIMLAPLGILAVFSIASAYPALLSLAPVDAVWGEATESQLAVGIHFGLVFYVSLAALILGAGSAVLLYKARDKEPLNIGIFRNKFYFDELYAGIIKLVQDKFATLISALDNLLIDSFCVNGLSRAIGGVGSLFRRMQTGNLQGYAFGFGLGILVILYIALINT
ncbi:MAG: NADH-quinone oxidoreductase subunit L [Verrucomicrobiales bacterium]|jgi:NADH-quinone oxidoreductase subunit L